MINSPYGDTIYAVSSGPLPAGVAIVRISGPSASLIAQEMAGRPIPERVAMRTTIRNRNGAILDHCLALHFPGPGSFTGENVAELHLHGGRAVVDSVLSAIAEFPRTRMADAGEFTRRAFINGKIDLTSAESLVDLIEAETESQRRLALGNASGAQARLYRDWRAQLVEARALLEAELDFADEEDISGSVVDLALERAAELERVVLAHCAAYSRGEIIREGFRVVILGAPNAGKSSLLNALARRDVAIVSEEAGTTRDPIDVALDLDGIKVIVTDTAGIRDGAGLVENQGIRRALDRAGQADLVLWLVDSESSSPQATMPGSVVVQSKLDLAGDKDRIADLGFSSLSGAGLPELLDFIAQKAKVATTGDILIPSRARHRELLGQCALELRFCREEGLGVEIRAEHLRRAGEALGRLTGDIDVEDLLDVIFSRFCIGK